MNPVASFAQRFQSIENLAPPRWRLPLRYHGQRIVGGLEPEMKLLAGLIKPGDMAIDIGANRGVYAYALAKLASEVHCFEPLRECCHFIGAWNSPKVTVHNVALSDHPDLLQLYIPILGGREVYTRASLDRPGGAFTSRHVDVMTLDSFSFPRVDFIKIDVEGLEAPVLRGAKHTLESYRPTMLVEIDRERHSRDSFLEAHEMVRELGYETYVCDAGALAACDDAWGASIRHINFIFAQRRKKR